MAINTPSTVYPLAAKGVAIPLDVARPVDGVMEPEVGSGESVIYAIPAEQVIVISVFSSNLATLVVKDEDETVLATFHMVADTIYELAVQSPTVGTIEISNQDSTPATIIINQIERWSQLDNLTYSRS